jgi:hypothetical protein
MKHLLKVMSICALAATGVNSAAVLQSNPFENTLRKRQSGGQNSLQVDLGYSVYVGVQNSTIGINTFKG